MAKIRFDKSQKPLAAASTVSSGINMRNRLLLFLLLTLNAAIPSDSIQCMDQNNLPVEWFVIYKLPSLKFSNNKEMKNGEAFLFMTNEIVSEGWSLSDKKIDSDETPIAFTLAFLENEEKNNLLWLVYNDQGNVECEHCGHTKGFVAGDSFGGFWLIHSIPHYLENAYPTTGLRFGQSALCISLPKEELNNIGDFLQYNQPNFQEWNMNEDLKKLYPKITAALFNPKVEAPYNYQKEIITKQGIIFQGFAKSRDFNEDLYEWISSNLMVDLYTETWINEAGVLPSSCETQFRVINVLAMKFDQLGIYYSSHKDHSKIAIAGPNFSPWVCIGDINRATSQEYRGGGTVCLNDKNLWNAYNSLIKTVQECITNEYPYTYFSINSI